MNKVHKSLINVMGKPLIWYTIQDLLGAGIKDLIIVQGRDREVENNLKQYRLGQSVKYVIQPDPKGMGDSLARLENLVKDHFFVVDSCHFGIKKFLKEMTVRLNRARSEMVLVGKKTKDPQNYGILNFKGDKALGVIEKPGKGKAPSDIMVVGIYLLSKSFFKYYRSVEKHQYDFESALDLAMKETDVRVVFTDKETLSLKYPWHLLKVSKFLITNLLREGADKSSRASKGVVIGENVFIGRNVKIFEGAVIKDFCYIGDNCVIGNNAIVREYVNLENGVVVGALTEVTRSVFQSGTHVHAGYFGDCLIGKDCRFGAGFVSANRRLDRGSIFSVVKGQKIDTRLTSFGAVVGEGSKIAIGVGTMPGVFIGRNCLIGPGSVVFENVPDNTKLITKFQTQTVKLRH